MRHVFRVTKMGWDSEQEGVWFDSDYYTEEEARAQFVPFEGITQKGYPYTGYLYAGEKYYDVSYLGIFEDDKMPMNNDDYIEYILKKTGL